MEEIKNAFKIFVGKPESESPFGRPSRKWEDSIAMSIMEMVWKLWIGLIWHSSCEHGN